MKNPYSKFPKKELIARDHLAISRTSLANERTLLAYIRTFIALLIAGGTLLHFSREAILYLLSAVLIATSLCVLVFGIAQYRKAKRNIESIEKE